jgi:hypothetical protein
VTKKDGLSVSLKSRIRAAQGTAATRVKPHLDSDPSGDASEENSPATMSMQDFAKDETSEAAPTVDEIRAVLLRKSATAKKTP